MLAFVNKLDAQVQNGEIKKVNERYSFNIGVSDNGKHFSCTVIEDRYEDLDGNHLYRAIQHIDKNRNYHTVDLEEFVNGFFQY